MRFILLIWTFFSHWYIHLWLRVSGLEGEAIVFCLLNRKKNVDLAMSSGKLGPGRTEVFSWILWFCLYVTYGLLHWIFNFSVSQIHGSWMFDEPLLSNHNLYQLIFVLYTWVIWHDQVILLYIYCCNYHCLSWMKINVNKNKNADAKCTTSESVCLMNCF